MVIEDNSQEVTDDRLILKISQNTENNKNEKIAKKQTLKQYGIIQKNGKVKFYHKIKSFHFFGSRYATFMCRIDAVQNKTEKK